MKCRSLPYLFFLAGLCALPIRAQNVLPLIAGVTGGESFGVVDGSTPLYPGFPGCGLFDGGLLTSTRFGAILSAPFFFSSRFGLALRPAWRASAIDFSMRPEYRSWVYDSESDQAIEREEEFQLQERSQTLSLALMGTFNLNRRLALSLGPEVGYRFQQSLRQTERVLGPGDFAFPDGQTVREMSEGEEYSANPVTFALAGSISATLPMGPRLSAVLEVSATADLLSPVREAVWRSLSLGGNAGIVFALTKKESPPPPPVPVIVEPVSPPLPSLALSASIEVYGLEDGGRRDTITSRFREKEYCRSLEFVAEVLFDDGAAVLPDPYRREGKDSGESADDATSLPSLPTLDSLALLDPSALQNHVLDVIALRLVNNPASTIVLHPFGKDVGLGEARSGAIRNYLADTWGIQPERVIAENASVEGPSPDARGRSERVVIESSSPGLLAPIISRRLDRDFEAPLVKVATSHQADAGLRAWEVTLTSRNLTIARYSSTGPAEDGSASMNWNMLYDEGGDSSTITALFMVEDSTGKQKTVRNAAPLMMLRSRIAVAHSINMKERTETLLFRLDGSANRGRDSLGYEDVLREIDRTLRPGARVSIAENTGSSGEDIWGPPSDALLKALLRRHGIGEPESLTINEIIATAGNAENCIDPERLRNAALIVMVRQGVE